MSAISLIKEGRVVPLGTADAHTHEGTTVAHAICKYTNPLNIREYLAVAEGVGVPMNHTDPEGNQPLHYALARISASNNDTIGWVWRLGDLAQAGSMGTPLHIAVVNDDISEQHVLDIYERLPVMGVCATGCKTLLIDSIEHQRFVLAARLVTPDAAMRPDREGNNAAHVAAFEINYTPAGMFVTLAPYLASKNADGLSAVDIALGQDLNDSGYVCLRTILVEAGDTFDNLTVYRYIVESGDQRRIRLVSEFAPASITRAVLQATGMRDIPGVSILQRALAAKERVTA
jgi:hypothetical protein